MDYYIENSMRINLKESLINKLMIFILVSWIILAVVFGFIDLEISKAVVDENSVWGNFGEEFGEAPGYGLIAIALSAFIGSLNKDVKKQKIPAYIIIIFGIFILLFGIIFNSQSLIVDGAVVAISLITFVIFTFNKDWNNYRNISLVITILTILNPLLFVQLTKILTGRVRFIKLAIDFSNYTPWFLPPGPSGNNSFPSGHTSMSFMFLPLLILVKDRKWKDIIRIIVSFLVIGWAIFVGVSRIVVGAHYASDVLFSAGMAAIITIISYKMIYLRERNANKEEK
ncbi:hypothetical protein LCGC14_0628380 [marine sediment metagenome]|uniref:Phosphatidic acid phosphatase type 2/haloperoxidase domain-containing protein n=1 Tax=marine sediment metagenome TaxID=412755 RepID=A0A0F9R7W5_9ZZZZ